MISHFSFFFSNSKKSFPPEGGGGACKYTPLQCRLCHSLIFKKSPKKISEADFDDLGASFQTLNFFHNSANKIVRIKYPWILSQLMWRHSLQNLCRHFIIKENNKNSIFFWFAMYLDRKGGALMLKYLFCFYLCFHKINDHFFIVSLLFMTMLTIPLI